jgi:hypothetical protein
VTASTSVTRPGGSTSRTRESGPPAESGRGSIARPRARLPRSSAPGSSRAKRGMGGPKRADLTLDKTAALFVTWAEANKRDCYDAVYASAVLAR